MPPALTTCSHCQTCTPNAHAATLGMLPSVLSITTMPVLVALPSEGVLSLQRG